MTNNQTKKRQRPNPTGSSLDGVAYNTRSSPKAAAAGSSKAGSKQKGSGTAKKHANGTGRNSRVAQTPSPEDSGDEAEDDEEQSDNIQSPVGSDRGDHEDDDDDASDDSDGDDSEQEKAKTALECAKQSVPPCESCYENRGIVQLAKLYKVTKRLCYHISALEEKVASMEERIRDSSGAPGSAEPDIDVYARFVGNNYVLKLWRQFKYPDEDMLKFVILARFYNRRKDPSYKRVLTDFDKIWDKKVKPQALLCVRQFRTNFNQHFRFWIDTAMCLPALLADTAYEKKTDRDDVSTAGL